MGKQNLRRLISPGLLDPADKDKIIHPVGGSTHLAQDQCRLTPMLHGMIRLMKQDFPLWIVMRLIIGPLQGTARSNAASSRLCT